MSEICDNIDNNCNGEVDEGIQNTYYLDSDSDGFGDVLYSIQTACSPQAGYVLDNTDCDDTNSLINPGILEITSNNVNDDCNSSTVDVVEAVVITVTDDINPEPTEPTELTESAKPDETNITTDEEPENSGVTSQDLPQEESKSNGCGYIAMQDRTFTPQAGFLSIIALIFSCLMLRVIYKKD